MKSLPQILFWLGLASIPLSWLVWYLGPELELLRPVLHGITDPGVQAAFKESHAEHWGLFIGLWPVTLLVLSAVMEKRSKE